MQVQDGIIVGFSKNEPGVNWYLGKIVANGLVGTRIHGYDGKYFVHTYNTMTGLYLKQQERKE